MGNLRFGLVTFGLFGACMLSVSMPAPVDGAFGGLVQMRYATELKVDQARRGVAIMDTAITVFFIDYGQYPASLQMLAVADANIGDDTIEAVREIKHHPAGDSQKTHADYLSADRGSVSTALPSASSAWVLP